MMLFSRRRVGSGSFGLPRALPGLSPLPAGPPRVSRLDHRPQPKPRADGPRDLYLSSRALGRGPEPPLGDASSPGFRSKPVCPSTDIPPVRPLPGAEAPIGPTVPPADRVPPPWFRTTMTAFSTQELRVCCTPQPVQGSSRFPLPSASPTRRPSGRRWRFPRRGSHPSKISLVNSRAASLRSLPSCRYRVPPEPLQPKPVGRGPLLAEASARATVFAQQKRGTSLGR